MHLLVHLLSRAMSQHQPAKPFEIAFAPYNQPALCDGEEISQLPPSGDRTTECRWFVPYQRKHRLPDGEDSIERRRVQVPVLVITSRLALLLRNEDKDASHTRATA